MTWLTSILRRARRSSLRASGSLRARAPGALEHHRDSWRDAAVAAQMVELADRQLGEPAAVSPFAAFLTLLSTIVEDPELPKPARFLDIGCGAGANGELLDRYAPGRFAYVGADYADEVLVAARARAPGRRFERRDIFVAGSLDGFDVVLASALLDVVPEPERALGTLLDADAQWVFLHRQRIRNSTRVGVVRGYRGQTTYSTSLARSALDEAAARAGRRVARSLEVEGDVWSFLLVRDGC